MSDRQMKLRVGIVAFATFVIAVLLVALNTRVSVPYGGGQQSLRITLESAPGVGPNTPVRKNGVLIGRVTDVDFDDDGVVITADVSKDVNLFTSDMVRVQPSSILGDAVISFSTPSEARGQPKIAIPEGTLIRGQVVPSPIDVLVDLQMDIGPAIKSLGEAGESVTELASRLNNALGEDLGEERINDFLDRATVALDEFSMSMAKVSEAADAIDSLVGDPQLQADIKTIVNDIPKLMTEARGVVQQAFVAVGSLDAAVNSANRNLQNVEGLTKPLGERGAQITQSLISSIDNLDLVMADAGRFTKMLIESEGTLGTLVNDRELYDNLNTVICNANSVIIRVNELAKQLRPVINDARVITDKVAREPGRILSGALNKGPGIK